MFRVFNNIDNLFNNLIITNNEDPIFTSKTNESIPISNKYFLTILDNKNDDIKSFFDYIVDDTRTLEYPLKKNKNIDYSFMVELEQFYQIDLDNSNLKEISCNLNSFFQIVEESEGEIVFVLDINYLIENFINSKKISPNHLIDFILWKLKNKVTYILLLDSNNTVKKYNNMLFAQLETCFINFDLSKYNLNKHLLVYKNVNEEVYENVYWNLLYPEMKITKNKEKIKLPYKKSKLESESELESELESEFESNTESESKLESELESELESNTEFSIVEINNKECFLHKITLSDIINKNLLNLNNNPGIIIDPTDRINIYYN